LGWVGKNLARELAPLIDKGLIPDYATVIELKCNLYEDVYGIKFLIDVSEHGNIYLLLDCDESTLDEICHLLGENDVDVLQSGISYRPGSNGKLYSWYLRLNRETNQQKLETLFRIHYPILEEKYDQELTAEYVELQEAELHHLKKENERLITSVKHLERIRDRSEQMNSSLQNQVREMLHLSLPNVEFIFDSVDILLNEIKDYASPIHHLVKLRFDNNYKGKKILLLDKWWELHFSTGQKDDGRLYFKRHGEKLLVLISFKKSQKRDIDRLKEFNA
jgi:hypothetical protein